MEAQRRLRAQAARQELVLRAYYKATEELEGLSAEEAALRTRFEAGVTQNPAPGLPPGSGIGTILSRGVSHVRF